MKKQPEPKYTNIHKISVTLEKLNTLQLTDIEHVKKIMIAITKLEKLNQREDPYKKFEYNHDRVLDALARILNIEICAAITHSKEQNQFILSFNSTLDCNQTKALNQTLTAINKALQNKNIYDIVYSDKSLIQQIKFFETNILGTGNGSMKKSVAGFTKFKDAYSKYELNDDKYAEFIAELQYNGVQGEMLDKFIRPIQDAKKLLATFNEESITEFSVDLLENPNNLHAEMNLLEYKIMNNLPLNDYIGISKLCCALCEFTLEGQVPHRGKHGVLYENGWNITQNLLEKIPNIIEKINKYAQTIIKQIIDGKIIISTKSDYEYSKTLLSYASNKKIVDSNVIEKTNELIDANISKLLDIAKLRNKNKMEHDLSDDEGEPINYTTKLFKNDTKELVIQKEYKESIKGFIPQEEHSAPFLLLSSESLLYGFGRDIKSNLGGEIIQLTDI